MTNADAVRECVVICASKDAAMLKSRDGSTVFSADFRKGSTIEDSTGKRCPSSELRKSEKVSVEFDPNATSGTAKFAKRVILKRQAASQTEPSQNQPSSSPVQQQVQDRLASMDLRHSTDEHRSNVVLNDLDDLDTDERPSYVPRLVLTNDSGQEERPNGPLVQEANPQILATGPQEDLERFFATGPLDQVRAPARPSITQQDATSDHVRPVAPSGPPFRPCPPVFRPSGAPPQPLVPSAPPRLGFRPPQPSREPVMMSPDRAGFTTAHVAPQGVASQTDFNSDVMDEILKFVDLIRHSDNFPPEVKSKVQRDFPQVFDYYDQQMQAQRNGY